MAHLGSISGVARVVVDGNDVGEAEYEISVSQPRHLKEARGSIIADSAVIWAAFESDTGAEPDVASTRGMQLTSFAPR